MSHRKIMKIMCCFQIEPCWDGVIDSDWASFNPAIDVSYAGTELNCFDEAALELALQIKEAMLLQGESCSCVAVTVGNKPPNSFVERLYAAGFDDVVCISYEYPMFQSEAVARILSDYALSEGMGVILTGEQSGNVGTGKVPLLLAELLEMPCLSKVISVEVFENGLRTVFDGDGIIWEAIHSYPIVLAVGNSPKVLRGVTLRARLMAKERILTIRELSSIPSKQEHIDLYLIDMRKHCEFLSLSQGMENLQEMMGNENGKHEADKDVELAFPIDIKAVCYKVEKSEAILGKGLKRWLREKVAGDKPELIILNNDSFNRKLAASLSECGYAVALGVEVVFAGGEFVRLKKSVCSFHLEWRQLFRYPAVITIDGNMPKGIPVELIPNLSIIDDDEQFLIRSIGETKGNNLKDCKRVVLCGAGMGSAENCDKARLFAQRLGAGFGLTRNAVMKGWGDISEIVGLSGVTLSADSCLVIGASGAGAFVSGLKDVKDILAVNIDRNSLIFRHADKGIVGDVAEFMELLVTVQAHL